MDCEPLCSLSPRLVRRLRLLLPMQVKAIGPWAMASNAASSSASLFAPRGHDEKGAAVRNGRPFRHLAAERPRPPRHGRASRQSGQDPSRLPDIRALSCDRRQGSGQQGCVAKARSQSDRRNRIAAKARSIPGNAGSRCPHSRFHAGLSANLHRDAGSCWCFCGCKSRSDARCLESSPAFACSLWAEPSFGISATREHCRTRVGVRLREGQSWA